MRNFEHRRVLPRDHSPGVRRLADIPTPFLRHTTYNECSANITYFSPVSQLDSKVREKIDSSFKDRVSVIDQQDAFQEYVRIHAWELPTALLYNTTPVYSMTQS